MNWERLAIGFAVAIAFAAVALVVWYRRSAMSRGETVAHVRSLGVELIRLPGRLRRVAADPRTPRRARWWLIGLAIYVASPIDPIPDFIPVIGHLDELIVVPIVLAKVRRMIPPEVWAEYFPPHVAGRLTPPTPAAPPHPPPR